MKKGFTLIELIAVLIIIGLVLLITIPVTKNMIESNKEEQYMSYVGLVEKALYTYADMQIADNPTSNVTRNVTINTLINNNYIKEFEIKTVKPNGSTQIQVVKYSSDGSVKINGGADINLKFGNKCCTKSSCSSC